jgi:hypothetical protein
MKIILDLLFEELTTEQKEEVMKFNEKTNSIKNQEEEEKIQREEKIHEEIKDEEIKEMKKEEKVQYKEKIKEKEEKKEEEEKVPELKLLSAREIKFQENIKKKIKKIMKEEEGIEENMIRISIIKLIYKKIKKQGKDKEKNKINMKSEINERYINKEVENFLISNGYENKNDELNLKIGFLSENFVEIIINELENVFLENFNKFDEIKKNNFNLKKNGKNKFL